MDDNTYNDKPEPLLRFIAPSNTQGIAFERPGHLRTFATLFSLSMILIGGALLTSWLVFRQSTRRRDRHTIHEIIRKTRLDLPKYYNNAISALSMHPDLLGRSVSAMRQGEYSILLALSHDLPEQAHKATYLAAITGKRNISSRELLKSMTAISELMVSRRFHEAAMLIEREMVTFPRSHLHLFALAMARMELGNWEAAHSSVSMAIELGDRPIPYRLLQAVIERKRGKTKHARVLLDEILKQSPGHPHALLELYLLTGEGKLPGPDGRVSRRELAKVWLSHALTQTDPAEKKRLCEKAQNLWYMPETSLCIAEAILHGAGPLDAMEKHLARLATFPIPEVRLLRAEYYVKELMPEKAVKAMATLKKCPSCDTGRIAALSLKVAILVEDRDSVHKTCGADSLASARLETCLDGAIELSDWGLVKRLMSKLPDKELRRSLQRALFSHSIEAAFAPVPVRLRPYRAKLLAGALITAQRYHSAIFLLNNTMKRHGHDPSMVILTARAYAAMGRTSKALAILDGLRPHIMNHPDSLFQMARLYMDLNKIGAAHSIVVRLTKLVPEGYRALYIRALIHLHRKAYDKATKMVDRASKVTANNPLILLARARILFFEGRYPEAVKAVEQAVAVDRGNPQYFEVLARYSRHYKQAHYGTYYLKAAKAYKALGANYQASRVLAEYGSTLDIKTMRDEKSRVVALLEPMKQLHPEALSFLAEWHHAQNIKGARAAQLMEQAIALSPDLPINSYRLATWLAGSDPKKAMTILNNILVSFSYHSITPQAEALLATLRKGTPR